MAFIVHGASFQGQDLGADLTTMVSQPSLENALICTGCNNFKAGSHDELKEHYKTEWHRHNLKRKVAGLAPIDKDVFEERVASYVSDKDQARGKKKEHLSKKARDKQEKREQQAKERQASGQPEREQQPDVELPDFSQMTEEEFMDWKTAHSEKLDITDSLFDRNTEENVSENLEYMAKQYGFFIPFLDSVSDLEGLVEYLGQKVSIGNCCLWCAKSFSSLEAVRGHMVDKAHCKMCVEGCEDEYQDFYSRDLSATLGVGEEDEEWETDDEMELDGADKARAEAQHALEEGRVVATQGRLAEAARMSKKHARAESELVVTADAVSKVLGHRAFQKYYRQKLRPEGAGGRRGGEANAKIIGLLTDSYKANGILAQYKGSSRVAKANRQLEKQELQREHKWWMKVGVRANKFHQVRREDYHA